MAIRALIPKVCSVGSSAGLLARQLQEGVAGRILIVGAGLALASCMSEADRGSARLAAEIIATARSVGIPDQDPFFVRAVAAQRSLPREWFIPHEEAPLAYIQGPLPIGFKQTISDPYIVAIMTAAAQVRQGSNALEVGTGSGYQAAVLAWLGARVTTIEIVPELAVRAARTLKLRGFGSVAVHNGDGFAGWPARAPFDVIMVTAGAPAVPRPLLDQLAVGGRLVMPVGPTADEGQILVYERGAKGMRICSLGPVKFVPLTGPAQAARHDGDRPDDVQPFCFGRAVS